MNSALSLGSFAFFTALAAAIPWWKSGGGDSGSNDGFWRDRRLDRARS